MILVIGGNSRTGSELVRLLRGGGQQLRILTRHGEPGNADSVVGDLADPSSLDAAMRGVDKVFLLCSAAPDELAWHTNAIEAAARNGVRHLVRSSIIGADLKSPSRFIQHHGEADELLVSSGLGYTILRPNMYMHNVSALWEPSVGPDGNYYAPAGDARISMVDARDVGAVAAAALTDDEHIGKTYDLTGPAALSHAEACEILGQHMGRKVNYVAVTDDAAREGMLGAGLDEWTTDALIELYQDYRRSGTDGYAAQTSGAVRQLTGRDPRGLDAALGNDGSGA